ncbi:MAG: T9SS type A sorting domain-containing protein, partial [Methanosarcinaceae archaeon]
DAHLIDHPNFQSRGTYIMHIDQNGQYTTNVNAQNFDQNVIPNNFSVVKAYPNPFRDNTKLIIQNNQRVNFYPSALLIYNILGKEVKRYDLKHHSTIGAIELMWHGEDRFGQKVSPGVYFYQVLSNDLEVLTDGKLTFIK